MTRSSLWKQFKEIKALSQTQEQSDWQNILPSMQLEINRLYIELFEPQQKSQSSNLRDRQQQQTKMPQDKQPYALLALCFYGVAKISQRCQPFEKAISVLNRSAFPIQVQILWRLQSAAVFSSIKKHQQAFDTAISVIEKSIELLAKLKCQKHQKIIDSVIKQYTSNSQMIPIWFYNKNHHLSNFNTAEFGSHYLMSDNFQIADIMAMEIPEFQDFEKEVRILTEFQKSIENANPRLVLNTLQKMILYISIGCFTRATQSYYLKNYSEKYFHVKAIKIASFIFTSNSSYIEFLLSTLSEHFGKHLKSIEQVQENSISLISQLKRVMPKDTKQVPMTQFVLCDE